MRKTSIFVVIFFVLFSFYFSRGFFVRAIDCQGDATCTQLSQDIEKLQKDLEASVNATTPLVDEVKKLDARIKSIQSAISSAKKKANDLAIDVEKREAELGQTYTELALRVRRQYMQKRSTSDLEIFFSNTSSSTTRALAYRASLAKQDEQKVHELGAIIIALEEDKKRLEQEQKQLAGLQVQIDKQASFFKQEIANAVSYQQSLRGKIAEFSAKQQSILSEKSGTFQTTVGDVPLADDFNASPAFSPPFSPAFAVFSFGAPHFNGLSQYGALGRSKEGQSADQILHAYYGDVEIKKDYDQNTEICVGSSASNCERMSMETYAKRIYEVPNGWGDQGGMEALKAQAVAARSYALADMQRRGYICATESCQVYKSSNKGGNWESAVNATAGWVLMKNGKPLWAKYASTAGGYIDAYTDSASTGHRTPSFWDTKNGRDGWTSQAFEKIAGSPWFYKAWYKTRGGDSCGRSHPWLTQEETADVLNAWIVLSNTSESRISPLGGCWGGNPYSMSELRDRANGYGGAVTSVSDVHVEYSNDGYTANVIFQTNKGEVSISGSEFKKVFNIRAPGNISVKSGLFNVEKR
ncbi:MAG: SpoIID/LytB domain-containing protein [Microgenomates group bacterium GW2011_GWF2_45_18]|nr:MAG: SpoIID/LytB domain-containing protein [Microgenomates group bacterium GW2011_GWF1_44_10]KKU01905.1 MAG: SpoIID/LytB domain-containing protein [Microgenomates group bacterium GW2011_GWF2_45_18]HAU98778.1 hypothetical protein [Candidatus Paceibacterota bacterium]HAX01402.1 hypothetical protein [Candidatus Paceibacterota bacterium]